MESKDITHIFFDIGGVLGTNAWDREQRAHAVDRFDLDPEFDSRHQEVVGEFESGRLTLHDYLESVVFYRERPFTREEIVAFMFSQSEPFPESLDIARELSRRPGLRLMTLNNESAELNLHRIAAFGLRDIFSAFLSSCWLGVRKPQPVIFERALAIAQVKPERVVFVDDREQNLAPARAQGMQTILFTSADALRESLRGLGLL
jgi:putative hydrolase of the HAD superfamily